LNGAVQILEVPMKDYFPTNLRRLVFFHHASAREASKVLGVSEHAVSAWITGKRRPGVDALMRLSEIYEINPRFLTDDPITFAGVLALPERIQTAENNIRRVTQQPRLLVVEHEPDVEADFRQDAEAALEPPRRRSRRVEETNLPPKATRKEDKP
jgi:transcriptional regulator with XRE-family HTH domain